MSWFDVRAAFPSGLVRSYLDRVLSKIFCLGGGGGVKMFWNHAAVRKIFLGLLEGSGGMLPRKIFKRFGLAEIAFLDISNLH